MGPQPASRAMTGAAPRAHIHAHLRALAYPFEQPSGPFVFHRGAAVYEGAPDFAALMARAMETPRVAVIACGSNASPARLAEKFAADALVPTLRIELAGHVVTHSAKFCSYGAMPATLHPWPGARARLFVNLLDEAELAAMDVTERLGDEYDRVAFDPAAISGLPEGTASVQAYVSRAGALACPAGRPMASAAASQDAPDLAPASQRDAVQRAMAAIGADGPVEDFLDRAVADEPFRRAANSALAESCALRFSGG